MPEGASGSRSRSRWAQRSAAAGWPSYISRNPSSQAAIAPAGHRTTRPAVPAPGLASGRCRARRATLRGSRDTRSPWWAPAAWPPEPGSGSPPPARPARRPTAAARHPGRWRPVGRRPRAGRQPRGRRRRPPGRRPSRRPAGRASRRVPCRRAGGAASAGSGRARARLPSGGCARQLRTGQCRHLGRHEWVDEVEGVLGGARPRRQPGGGGFVHLGQAGAGGELQHLPDPPRGGQEGQRGDDLTGQRVRGGPLAAHLRGHRGRHRQLTARVQVLAGGQAQGRPHPQRVAQRARHQPVERLLLDVAAEHLAHQLCDVVGTEAGHLDDRAVRQLRGPHQWPEEPVGPRRGLRAHPADQHRALGLQAVGGERERGEGRGVGQVHVVGHEREGPVAAVVADHLQQVRTRGRDGCRAPRLATGTRQELAHQAEVGPPVGRLGSGRHHVQLRVCLDRSVDGGGLPDAGRAMDDDGARRAPASALARVGERPEHCGAPHEGVVPCGHARNRPTVAGAASALGIPANPVISRGWAAAGSQYGFSAVPGWRGP